LHTFFFKKKVEIVSSALCKTLASCTGEARFLGWFYAIFFGENLHRFTLLFLPFQSLEYGWWVGVDKLCVVALTNNLFTMFEVKRKANEADFL
jgi:hypothetical protein